MNEKKNHISSVQALFITLFVYILMLVIAALINNVSGYALILQEAVPGMPECFRETRYYYNAYSELTNTYYEPIVDESGKQLQITRYIFAERPN